MCVQVSAGVTASRRIADVLVPTRLRRDATVHSEDLID